MCSSWTTLLLFTIVCSVACKDIKVTPLYLSYLNKEMYKLQSSLLKQSMAKDVFLKETLFETTFQTRCTNERCSTRVATLKQVHCPQGWNSTGGNCYRVTTSKNALCPKGWRSGGGSCYRLFKEKINWYQAQMTCHKYKSVLAQPQDEREKNWITKEFANSKAVVWIDAVDLGKEGQWTWFSSGQTLRYFSWKWREPNNAGGKEHCVILDITDDGDWDDRQCQVSYSFLCEKHLNQN